MKGYSPINKETEEFIIRYIENIPDRSKDDLKIPDVRLTRPKNLIIYDNFKKKIHYIENVFADISFIILEDA